MKDKMFVIDGTGYFVSAEKNKRVWPFRVLFYKNWPLKFDPDVIEFKTFAEAVSYYIRHGVDSRMVVERVAQYDIGVQKC